jgi:hypothetical protein
LPTANVTQEPGTITPVQVPVASTPSATDQKAKTDAQAAQRRRPSQAQRPQQPAEQPARSPFFFFR